MVPRPFPDPKFNMKPSDASPENDCASPDVKTPSYAQTYPAYATFVSLVIRVCAVRMRGRISVCPVADLSLCQSCTTAVLLSVAEVFTKVTLNAPYVSL